jgi:hypothetical protein
MRFMRGPKGQKIIIIIIKASLLLELIFVPNSCTKEY